MLPVIASLVLSSAPAQTIRNFAASIGDRPLSPRYVEEALGKPDRVTLGTCGTKTRHPWRCLVWTFDANDDASGLTITFERTKIGWLVNNYSSF